jgi:hypothetical protein
MRDITSRSTLLIVSMLVVLSVAACGGTDTAGTDTSAGSGDTPAEQAAEQPVTRGTEVVGMPAEFPSDVPVHPGTVTEYDPIEVTENSTVHQLYVESQASFDDVVAWYQDSLPAGWSVGYFEDVDDEGIEAKIALDGGDYTPADPEGVGGGVLVGVFANDDATLIVTTVTVMGAP